MAYYDLRASPGVVYYLGHHWRGNRWHCPVDIAIYLTDKFSCVIFASGYVRIYFINRLLL